MQRPSFAARFVADTELPVQSKCPGCSHFGSVATGPVRTTRQQAWDVPDDTVVVGYVGRLITATEIETLIGIKVA